MPSWVEFVQMVEELEDVLQKFQNKIQRLSSSAHLSITLQDLGDSIRTVASIVQENASWLSPELLKEVRLPFVRSQPYGIYEDSSITASRLYPPNKFAITSRALHMELNTLADDINDLRKAVTSFPEFSKIIEPHWPLAHVEEDLKYWSSCLHHYTDEQYRLRGTRLYVLDLSKGIADHFKDMTRIINAFITRVPAAVVSQERLLSNLQNQSTMATFFSGVTATMIQYSLGSSFGNTPGTKTGLAEISNAFWFGSLVLSVASALIGFSAYIWRRALYSSPRTSLPPWLWDWLRLSPGIFLVLSVIMFMCGLAVFSVSSQPVGTQVVVFVCEAAGLLSLAPLLFWALSDRLRHAPRSRNARIIPMETPSLSAASSTSNFTEKAKGGLGPLQLPLHSSKEQLPTKQIREEFNQKTEKVLQPSAEGNSEEARSRTSLNSKTRTTSVSTVQALAQRNVRRLVDLTMVQQRMSKLLQVQQSISSLEEKLKRIVPVSGKLEFDELLTLGYPKFDSAGKKLALATIIRSAAFEVDDIGQKDPVLWKSQLNFTDVGTRELAWSYCGECILTWTVNKRFLHIWSLNDGAVKTHKRPGKINHIQGLPASIQGISPIYPSIPFTGGHIGSSPRFIFVEDSNTLGILDVEGTELLRKSLDNIRIEHLDILGSESVIMLATVVRPSQNHDLGIIRAVATRKLILYNLGTCEIQCEVPLWKEARSVSVLDDGNRGILIAVSYLDEPPQIWSIKSGTEGVYYLSLERQLRSKFPGTKFRGCAQWLNNNNFLVCLTTEGEAVFWRRDREEPIHTLLMSGMQPEGKDKAIRLTCSPRGDDFMFVTKSVKGVIRFWSTMKAKLEPLDLKGTVKTVTKFHSPVSDVDRVSMVSLASMLDLDDSIFQ
ncbi:hypothetical protein M422DRAFT_62878 [Sphaerobolus stellatus SS14]|nr:hypothetical protein M422DRAFT_62878 [Sphaerobolus stellatus SS14]